LVAREAHNAKDLVDDLSRKNVEAEKQIKALSDAIEKGTSAVAELQNYATLISTTVKAQGDDRNAYDQLWAWSKDDSFTLNKEAKRAADSIMEQYDQIIMVPRVQWKEGVESNLLSLRRLSYNYWIEADKETRIAILSFVWKRTDIPQRDRLGFLVDVMRKEQSIRLAEYAGRIFSKATDNGLKPLALVDHIKWWEESIINKAQQ